MMDFDRSPSGPTLVGITVKPKCPKSKSKRKSKSPKDARRLSFTMNVVSLSNRNIGFKVRTNKPLFYTVNPNRGFLPAKKSTLIEVTISPYVTRQVIQSDPEQHSFMFIGIVWNAPTFDNEMFEALESTTTAEKQVITITEGPSSKAGEGEVMGYGSDMAMVGLGYGAGMGVLGSQQLLQTNIGSMGPGSVRGPNMATGPGMYGGGMSGYSQYNPMLGPEMGALEDNNNLMTVFPLTLCFSPPYGQGAPKQSHEINVTCKSSETIAFQVQANSTMWKYYFVSPPHGVILPSSTTAVDFRMKDTFTHESLVTCTEKQCFVIAGIPWPKKLAVFDEDVFADLQKVHFQKQSTLVNIEVDKNAVGYTSTNVKTDEKANVKIDEKANVKTGEKEIDETEAAVTTGPELVKVHPAVLTFNPPYGKRKQTISGTLTSKCSKKVAFKVYSNRLRFYWARPTRGVLFPFKTIEIDFEMNEKFTLNEVKSDPKQHIFRVLAMEWTGSEFDPAIWDRLSKNKKLLQSITFDVQIPGAEFKKCDMDEEEKRAKKKYDELDDDERQPKKNRNNDPEHEEDDKEQKKENYKENKLAKKKEGNHDYVTVEPMFLSFKPPFGKKRQQSHVTLKNTSSELIGYKVLTFKPNFYMVKRGKGLLPPGKDVQTIFELNESFTDNDVKDADANRFEVMALPWPNDKEYDPETFKTLKLEAKQKEELQTLMLKINFK